jgi:hypothetical protein
LQAAVEPPASAPTIRSRVISNQLRGTAENVVVLNPAARRWPWCTVFGSAQTEPASLGILLQNVRKPLDCVERVRVRGRKTFTDFPVQFRKRRTTMNPRPA